MVVDFTEQTLKLEGDRIHVCSWKDRTAEPRRLIVLLHGLMMHGKAFDGLARHLAAEGFHVVAPDLRGFGRWYFAAANEKESIDYNKSLDDTVKLLRNLKESHPELPLFCLGESLGAHDNWLRDTLT